VILNCDCRSTFEITLTLTLSHEYVGEGTRGPVRRRRAAVLRRGFSAVELLVVIGILLVLVSIFVPYLLKIRETDHRVKCADNLRVIRAGLSQYATTNNGDYPRVVYDPTHPGYTCYTGVDGGSPFAKDSGVQPNDVTASLWLLVRMKLVEPRAFICPSTSDEIDPIDDASGRSVPVDLRGNFRGPDSLSYSYASPFSSAPGYRLNDTQRSGFAVMSDKNSGNGAGVPFDAQPLQFAVANSANHAQAGQNVLYADGHVDFQPMPYCGVERDNIFTALASKPLEKGQESPPKFANGVIGRDVGPAWESDSYLVPTASDRVETNAPTTSTTMPATQAATAPTTQPPSPAPLPLPPPLPPPAPPATQPATMPTTAPASQP
jgi:prepilin-type N-terminal cleavage/methylation domain-containing protein/prepilin-type processing-associated H-X9-DG protein